jgi:16S rRNA (cytosine1402-N4)-methyltransferase
MPHQPVMLTEVLDGLELGNNKTILDATLGYGGHAEAILDQMGPGGTLIGIDRDGEALGRSGERLKRFGDQVILEQAHYGNFDHVLVKHGLKHVDGMLLDLGVSSPQLDEAHRGFSFRQDGPLDMRMDSRQEKTAFDLVNFCKEKDLETIFRDYGDERFAKRYARAIVYARQKEKIITTAQLEEIIFRSCPIKTKKRIHPATRVFQAIRIAVNDELDGLSDFLEKFSNYLKQDGRIAILSYHSLEDRLVKRNFQAQRKTGELQILTKKPLTPSLQETQTNPRSRSAKLRIAIRMRNTT